MRPRQALDALTPYQPGKPAAGLRRELGLERVVKLASNEGVFGPFPAAADAIARWAPELNRYPERAPELVERLAERHGVPPERVCVGSGADGIVNDLSLAYLDPGDEALMGWPSFVGYPLAARKMGAAPVHAPLREGSYDAKSLADRLTSRTRIVYVCNPNNPTGGMMPRAELAALLDAVPQDVLVVVDEAYHEYVTDPDYPDAIAEHGDRPNVAALRTFSKIYGLAGLRIGYLVGPAAVVEAVGKVRNAFATTELAHVAALASLDDPDELRRRRDATAEGRERLREGLEAMGLPVLPSVANFLCAEVGDGASVAAALEREGVIVRPLAGFGAPQAIRVTVGTPDEVEAVLAALARCLQAV